MNLDYVKSNIVKNSVWGISSNIIQTIFVSSFFIIVARKYSPDEFARVLIANTIYQLMAAFASMGLGQWFIREYETATEKLVFSGKFLKIQIGFGIFYYLLSIPLALAIYSDPQIRLLCMILGTNIIFDNFINAVKTLNVAEFRQKETAVMQIIDGFLKLVIGCLLLVNPFSITTLAILMIIARILTLTLFINIGSANTISFKLVWDSYISLKYLKALIVTNWQFIIIGSISIVYWRIANVIIAKFLTLRDVADYEVASGIFSIVSILPVIVSVTIYPHFIKYFKEQKYSDLRGLYNVTFGIYCLLSVTAYAFFYSFSKYIIPAAFGESYPGAILCLQEMFLTFLVLPTVLLQANMIVALGLEKLDMRFNIVSLLVYVTVCCIGLLYYRLSLSVINYSIFFSFIVFHFCQDLLLIKKKISTVKLCLMFYAGMAMFVYIYQLLAKYTSPFLLFFFFLMFAGVVVFLIKRSLHPVSEL